MRRILAASVWSLVTAWSLASGAAYAQVGAGRGGGGTPAPDGSRVVVPPARETVADGSAVITGVVLDGQTNTPIADAIVYLSGDNRTTVSAQTRQLTDARGRFAFVNLQPGTRYGVSAARFGYLDGAYGRDGQNGSSPFIELRDGQWVDGVNVPLFRPGAISGTIVDERGEPVAGVFVRVLARVTWQGRDELASGPTVTSDDRGMYRVAGLRPGRYLVEVPSTQATAPSSAKVNAAESALEVGDVRLILRKFPTPPAPVGGRPLAYPITFYPSTASLASASIIDLKYGEDRTGVDVAIQPVPAARVSGRVDGPAEALVSLTIRLVPEGLENLGYGNETASALVGADGRFTFLNVPAGSYILDAPREFTELRSGAAAGASVGIGFGPSTGLPAPPGTNGWGMNSRPIDAATPGTALVSSNYRGSGTADFWVRQSINVSETGDTHVDVALRHGGAMTGRVIAEPDPSRPAPTIRPNTLLHLEAVGAGAPLAYLRNDSRPDLPQDEFSIAGISSAQYLLRSAGEWIVKSITWKGRDYTDVPFDAAETQDFSGVEVTVTNASPTITGSVRNASGRPAVGAIVLMFPADGSLRQYGFTPSRIKTATVGGSGTFRLSGIPAGRYLAIALAASESNAWLDPAFLEKAERAAVTVSVGWGETRLVDLPVAGAIK